MSYNSNLTPSVAKKVIKKRRKAWINMTSYHYVTQVIYIKPL